MQYKHFGVMLDCSRNAVIKVSELKRFIDVLAKMGYNTLELYTEDTFEVEGEPYFGYMRGRYTAAELKEVDAYAAKKGIELIPCVQMLAHFTNLVKMPPYRELVDVNDILLADEEKTYALLDKIFATLAENFTSRLVNIGMDEAHMVGLGRYLDLHGYTDRFDILLRHLNRVAEIAKKYGFTPHMWSDMFFRLAHHGGYYGHGLTVPQEVCEKVPQNVELTYWDYYHTQKVDYDEMFRSHAAFGREVWFGGGAWCWNGFAPFNRYSMQSMKPAMESVREHGIENVFLTMWGDNGKECSFFALLPALYAIRQYADGNFDDAAVKEGFFRTFGMQFDDFMLLDLPNHTPTYDGADYVQGPCKALLYTDCFACGFDPVLEKQGVADYKKIEKLLTAAAGRAGEYAYLFQTEAALCRVLGSKATISLRTRKAYRAHDTEALRGLAREYGTLLRSVKKFYKLFAALWEKENKPFGWEVQDARLGGLMQRIASCKDRLLRYVNGELASIDELEADMLPIYGDLLQHNDYRFLTSVSEL